MTSKSLLGINLLSPLLFYQNPIDIYQTQTGSTQENGIPTEITSCRGCNQNLNCNDPATQYQRQKIIQKVVRLYASMYTATLASLAGYEKPLNYPQMVEQNGSFYYAPATVYWNQMSDRARPAKQLAVVASGSAYHTSSTRHTITRQRPGALSPGGVGVDIKHNSYQRYLNKIKGKGPIRRGIIPPNYGAPIPFDRAFPIYGGKIVKTGIVNGCYCPDIPNSRASEVPIYSPVSNALQDKILAVDYKFNIGDSVWAQKISEEKTLYKGQIIEIIDNTYKVLFEDGTIGNLSVAQIFIYFDCNNCNNINLPIKDAIFSNNYKYQKYLLNQFTSEDNLYCNILSILAESGVL